MRLATRPAGCRTKFADRETDGSACDLGEVPAVYLDPVPVHIGSSLLHHGLLSLQYLLGVEDVEEVDRHEEGHWDVPPHGVGQIVLWVDHRVLA